MNTATESILIETTTDPEAIPPQEVVNILIVDDEPKNLVVLETVLDVPGYRIVRASSGDEALMALMANEFAVLILDIRMPDMTGFELAQFVKQRKKTAQVPIIFLTAYYNEDQHILTGYDKGAVDYMHKPFNAAVMRSKVAVFADLYRQGRALEIANQALSNEVAERRLAEQRLAEANATLELRVAERTSALQVSEESLRQSHLRKDEFLATLAHELRNPLAPVRNTVEILRRKTAAIPELAWSSDLINRQIKVMSRLIDDLMDVSRISQGKINLRPQPEILSKVLQSAIESAQPLIEEMGHQLRLTMPEEPIEVMADATRLAQAFTNLITNAAKYTDKGGLIEIRVQRIGDEFQVRVIDSGIGIDEENLKRIFEMFSQVEKALARSRGGLGIGLSLTQRLVQMHGGSVRAISHGLGHGSEFEITLPCLNAESGDHENGDTPHKADDPGTALRVLVADDNKDAADTLAALLEILGHTVHTVYDGQAAVDSAGELELDVVLLDIGMPKLNGYQACQQIRALPGGHALGLVAVTGWGQPGDKQLAASAGFDYHLVKPVDPARLVEILASVLPANPGPPGA